MGRNLTEKETKACKITAEDRGTWASAFIKCPGVSMCKTMFKGRRSLSDAAEGHEDEEVWRQLSGLIESLALRIVEAPGSCICHLHILCAVYCAVLAEHELLLVLLEELCAALHIDE